MAPSRLKLQLVAFLLLSGGVAANLFLLQPQGSGLAATEPGQPWGTIQMAEAERAGFVGDTGSIGAPHRRGRGSEAAVELPHDIAEVTRAVQRELRIRGYETGAVDGVPGLMTRAAIMGFEFDHGLPLTGRASQDLLKSILLGGGEAARKRNGAPDVKSTAAAEVIRSVQRSLAKLGYRPDRLDGKLTPETARAIREFEVDQALPESGRISGPLVSRLARLTGRA